VPLIVDKTRGGGQHPYLWPAFERQKGAPDQIIACIRRPSFSAGLTNGKYYGSPYTRRGDRRRAVGNVFSNGPARDLNADPIAEAKPPAPGYFRAIVPARRPVRQNFDTLVDGLPGGRARACWKGILFEAGTVATFNARFTDSQHRGTERKTHAGSLRMRQALLTTRPVSRGQQGIEWLSSTTIEKSPVGELSGLYRVGRPA